MPADAAQRAIDAVWRIESPRLIAGLARMVRDVGVAEDLAQDALVAALEQWPRSGVPDNPGAWLMATAKRRAIDGFRRAANLERKQEELAFELGLELAMGRDDLDAALDDEIGDDLLGLIFTCCHPVLSTQARIALTLRMLGGPEDRRDRPRVPGQRGDGRPADRAGQEDAGRGRASASRCRRATSYPRGWRRCSRWCT